MFERSDLNWGFGVEILAFVGAAALGYAAWLWFRFTNFRSRLFQAFGVYGIPRDVADNLYTAYNGIINDLHINQGLSPEQIARVIVAEIGNHD